MGKIGGMPIALIADLSRVRRQQCNPYLGLRSISKCFICTCENIIELVGLFAFALILFFCHLKLRKTLK